MTLFSIYNRHLPNMAFAIPAKSPFHTTLFPIRALPQTSENNWVTCPDSATMETKCKQQQTVGSCIPNMCVLIACEVL